MNHLCPHVYTWDLTLYSQLKYVKILKMWHDKVMQLKTLKKTLILSMREYIEYCTQVYIGTVITLLNELLN